MTPVEARTILGLDKAACDLTEAIITRAYRRALVTHHPDTRIALEDAPVILPRQIKEAREVLRQAATGENNACAQCRGRGKVPSRVGAVTCGACKGTGDAGL
jgi:DnaJ-class molecular chaperone